MKTVLSFSRIQLLNKNQASTSRLENALYHGPVPWPASFPAAMVLQQNSMPQASLPLVNPTAPPGTHQTSPDSLALPSPPPGSCLTLYFPVSKGSGSNSHGPHHLPAHRTEALPHSALILPAEPPFRPACFVLHLAPPAAWQS